MNVTPKAVFEFLEEQRAKQASFFPALAAPKVLTFMGTTSQPGSYAAVGVARFGKAEQGSAPGELTVTLRAVLPRPPARGECITVHLTRIDQFQGYQIKTQPLAANGDEGALFERHGEDLLVKGKQIYTVHHSPYTIKFFEQIPFEELEATVRPLRVALLAVGETANVSPRFVYHQELKGDRVVLFHGDGLALKTYMNLRLNRQESRLALDLGDFSGYVLRGTSEEFAPHQHPEAYRKICDGFQDGGWGKPSRLFRLTAERFERVESVIRS